MHKDLHSRIIVHIKLHHRIENPVLSKLLELEFNTSGEVVREAVKEARRDGIPIAMCQHGYFLARNYEEFKSTLHNLESRATSLFKTIYTFKQKYGLIQNNQESLFN